MTFERYVAIGDSTVEGLDDPHPGGGYRGWADRLAELIAEKQGSVEYANLAVRGLTTRQVMTTQLDRALAMRPDLALVVSGTNDLLRRRFDPGALQRDVSTMQRALVGQGATLVTFTLPDLSDIMPIARMLRTRLFAMNDAIRASCRESGALLVDFAMYPVASDARLWSGDRLHANSEGHARMARALASRLGVIVDEEWAQPFDTPLPGGFTRLLRAEGAWVRHHLLPWLWRHANGMSSGDGVVAKRPELFRITRSR